MINDFVFQPHRYGIENNSGDYVYIINFEEGGESEWEREKAQLKKTKKKRHYRRMGMGPRVLTCVNVYACIYAVCGCLNFIDFIRWVNGFFSYVSHFTRFAISFSGLKAI